MTYPPPIPITQQLPEIGKEVLIFTSGQEKERVVGRLEMDREWVMELGHNYDEPTAEGYHPSFPTVFRVVNVTHWSPLPEYPKATAPCH